MKPRIVFLLLVLTMACQNSFAQKEPNKDSVKVYENIEKYSKKTGFRKFIYRMLFKSPQKSTPNTKNKRKQVLIKKSFDRAEGKIIRAIIIETLDPFGYSVENYKEIPEKGFEKFGNSIHMKTKRWIVRNLLLFKKNEPLDSLVIKESERLIRRQRYVRSVLIKPLEIYGNKDSVDVSVRVLDSWSLIPTASISQSRGNIELTERNFFGLGHELSGNFLRRFDTKQNGLDARYTINNIRNTFIKSTLHYNQKFDGSITRSAQIERAFFSPFTRLAGGILLENSTFIDSLPDTAGNFEIQDFSSENNDFWFGHSFKVFKGKNENDRATNLITSIRYKSLNFLKSASAIYDPTYYFSDEKLYLSSIGLSARKFAEDKYLFNFGIIEDFPYGQIYQITGGIQDKNNLKRTYLSGKFAYGDYFDFGYFGTNFEWGSFFNKGKSEESTIRVEANYFSNLLSLGSWKIRQFIKPSLVLGNHRVSFIKDRLQLTDQNGFNGYANPLINGTKKLTVAFQTQTYVNGNWHGFHFSPFYNMTFGLLGNEKNKVFDERLYSNFTLGVLINNDYLVFSNFQISFSFYPSIPFEGTNIFRTNAFQNNDLTLPDFQIGAPKIVEFE
jgi:hypothetical protein